MRIPLSLTVDVEPDYWNPDGAEGIRKGVPLILELFRRLGARGTFFWTADSARRHPDIVEAVMAEGHEIACHGLLHENLAALDSADLSNVVAGAARTLRSFGVECLGFRAPHLRFKPNLMPILVEQGFRYDSSIPFWGLRRFRYGKHLDMTGIQELKCIPSYAFRLTRGIFQKIVSRSAERLGYAVLFLHPWEIVSAKGEMKKLSWPRRFNFLNSGGIGPGFLDNLLRFLIARQKFYTFRTCLELAEEREKPLT